MDGHWPFPSRGSYYTYTVAGAAADADAAGADAADADAAVDRTSPCLIVRAHTGNNIPNGLAQSHTYFNCCTSDR